MTSNNITNPFNSGQPPLQIANPYTKLSGVQVNANVALPNVSSPYSFSTNYNNNANTINGLNNALIRYNAGQILTFSDQELSAISNTFNTFTIYQSLDYITLNVAQQQDLVIASNAIMAIQNTGVFVTEQDLINAGIEIQSANQAGFFPDGAQTVTCIDQMMVCEQPNTGSYYWSAIGNAADWIVTNQNYMESYSDQPLAMDQISGTLIGFGIQSIEFFGDDGQYPNPFISAGPGTVQNYGLAAVWSRAAFMNSIAFLGQSKTGQCHVFLLENFVPTIISNPDVDRIINALDVINDAVAYSYDMNGQSFYRITFFNGGEFPVRTLEYNGTTQIWHERQSGVFTDYWGDLTKLSTTFNGTVLASDVATGNVYLMDPNALTDNGFLIRREFISRHISMDGNEFHLAELRLDMSVGVGQQTGLGTNPMISLYVSTDGGNTWVGPRKASMGLVGQYGYQVIWRMLGSARDFVFKFVVTAPVQFNAIRGLAVQIPGTESQQ